MKDKVISKIQELESQYAQINTTQDEVELNQLRRQFDAKTNTITQKRLAQESIMEEINELNKILAVIEEFESEEDLVEEGEVLDESSDVEDGEESGGIEESEPTEDPEVENGEEGEV